MVFKKRKKWNSVDTSSGVAMEGARRNKVKGRVRYVYVKKCYIHTALSDCLEAGEYF